MKNPGASATRRAGLKWVGLDQWTWTSVADEATKRTHMAVAPPEVGPAAAAAVAGGKKEVRALDGASAISEEEEVEVEVEEEEEAEEEREDEEEGEEDGDDEEEEEEEGVKWLKHYSSMQSILVVGDGDFSFSRALAVAFCSGENLVSTSLDSYGIFDCFFFQL